ncbi:MAG: hypothetical protein CVV27_00345 [Candidatus Melainabacteria bacterium HGW-Melainabacteria-1]|nr:MAG: hypothetical protein CVV27_00345 [Candidatus Melainabacteria bacterium HGW-Melainabacteria-1]
MTNSDVQFSFGLRLGEREFHVGGDKIFVETQMEKWLTLFASQLPPELLNAGGNHPSSRPDAQASNQRRLPTLGEFIKTKEPKEISDVILVVGLYFERFQQKNLFTRTDLMNTIFNRLSKDETDVQQALTELVNKTFLTESATMGSTEMSYSLTFSGEQVVKEGFNH